MNMPAKRLESQSREPQSQIRLKTVTFLDGVHVDGIGTVYILKEADGWEITVTSVGLVCCRDKQAIWMPLGVASSGSLVDDR